MEFTNLGRSGLKVSRLCLGTMNFGTYTSEKESFTIMDKALDLGINFFDTANGYGHEKHRGYTEEIIGSWFAQGNGRRDKVVLAAKVYGTT
jgi:NDP-hexose C3-ketoreductase / dTDP-4-oxo-2-deoxy-alpha-D-pentos-2-ene 2,3-reductase